jgi:hypothetical protein
MIFLRALCVPAVVLCLAAFAAHAQEPSQPPAASPREAAPPPPDYSLPSSWAARPGAEGAAAAVAPGASPALTDPQVDVFYVQPTTDLSKTRWNQDIADAATNKWTDESVVARQGGVFNGCCRVFAPRYRQASIASFVKESVRLEAFAVAYGDVLRAFDYYIQHDNGGRPFILVGHSQGAAHVAQLLQDRIDGTPLGRRMVVAYVIGINVAEGDFGRTYKTIALCAKPDQTGCELAWNSVLPTGDRQTLVDLTAKVYVARHGDVPGKGLVCVNPLTFDVDKPAAGAEASRGAAPGSPGFGPLKPLVPHAVSARCDNGMLIVDPSPALDLQPLPSGAMHYHDIGLFYEDIRENALRRVQAYLSRSGG